MIRAGSRPGGSRPRSAAAGLSRQTHHFPVLRFRTIVFALAALLACGPLRLPAQAPAPGTLVRNQASMTFHDNASGQGVTAVTDTLRVLVSGGPGIDLRSDRAAQVVPGAWFALPHTLTNTGNAPGRYTLSPAQGTGGAFDVLSLALVVDANGNGLADPGEASSSFASGYAVTLAPGQSVKVVILGQVSPTTSATSGSVPFRLSATESTAGLSASNQDIVTMSATGTINFYKTASSPTAVRGQDIDYTLAGASYRSTPPGGIPVTVDGAPQSFILVRDVIPANTTFLSFIATTGSDVRPLYHVVTTADPNAYTTAPPADLRTVDAVAVGLPHLVYGDSFSAQFRVHVNANAANVGCSGSTPGIVNIGELSYREGAQTVVLKTNGVSFTVPPSTSSATFYLDAAFTKPTTTAHLGKLLYISVDAAGENLDPRSIDRIKVTVTSAKTGDTETLTAVETGPNTGIFRVPQGLLLTATAGSSGNGAIQTAENDTLTLKMVGSCATSSSTATLLVDPSGIVFDSQSCQPIAGVWVSLIDLSGAGLNHGSGGAGGALAEVYTDALGTTRAPNPVLTDAGGKYQFPFVFSSAYKLVVSSANPGASPPAANNTLPPSILPPSPCSASLHVGIGSRQETFLVQSSDVVLDIPLDIKVDGQGFAVRKTASSDQFEVGDTIVYTLTATNSTAYTFLALAFDDWLPQGLTYEPGSARLDGVKLADPAGGRGPKLTFATSAKLAPGGKVTLTYRVRIERDAPIGPALNTALARTTAGLTATTRTAVCTVRINDGVFTDKGIIIGKVFLDRNRNRVQDPGEPGVPGVRLYLEDGTFVVTDSEGKFSFYGVRPVAHMLKLDRTTLPAGAELIALDTRHAGDAGSRFVDLKKAEIQKANFALDAANPAVTAEIERRRKQGEVGGAEIKSGLDRRLEADARERPLTDIRSLPAAGVVAGSGGGAAAANATGPVAATTRASFTALLPPQTLTSANSSLAPEPVLPLARQPLENLAPALTDNTPGFIGLKNGDTVASRQIGVRLKGPLGAKLTLLLNGAPVAPDRLGKRVVDPIHQLEALEFYSIDLLPGSNRFELVVHDPFGNERDRVPLTVVAPDKLARLEVTFSNPEPVADGHTPVQVTVRLLDQAGTPITARTPVTLEARLSRWQVEDLNPGESGTQAFVEGGRTVFTLLPADTPGDDRIVVSSGAIKCERQLPLLPDLRPLIASGILEGTLFLKNGADLALRPTSASDAFEEELRRLSASGDVSARGRAAFFIKGKIKGDVLLTAGYDSDKRTQERLFRDIEPDKYYAVYGDSSLRGFDAQSSRRLYLRIDRQRSYLLIGDFQTRTDGEQRALGNYQRSLNGVRGHWENNRVVAEGWAARDTTAQVVQEIPADGTSGPYNFRAANGLLNSEQVEILTRDRNQPSVILRAEPMERFTDYDFEPLTGRLMFRDPVRSLDENLNPRTIRITYEVDQGGNPFWVYGANAQARVTDRIEVGGSYARDENPLDHQQLRSANSTVRLAANTYLLGEIAQSVTDLKGTGDQTEARLYYGETENRFVNPGALLSPGRVEAGTKVVRRLTPQDNLIVQGLITEVTSANGGKREGLRADLEHTYANHTKVEVGVRKSQESGTPVGPDTAPVGAANVPFNVNSVRAKVTVPVPRVRDAHAFAEYEQDVLVASQRLAAVGGDWQFASRGRVYARHEFISSLGGPFELNQTQQNNLTVVGVETDYLKSGQLFNEYRARDSLNGRESEASTGVRHRFELAPGLRLQAGLERVTPFTGTTQNESTALTTGLEYTDNPLWKGTARLEVRYANQNDSYLNTLGYARKLSRDWTFLGKTTYYQVINKGGTARDTLQARVLTGFAWRQTDQDVWNLLTKYEFRYEDGSPFDPSLDQLRHLHILSTSINYQPTHDWIFSARHAFELVDETISGTHGSYLAQQVNFRALREISKRWDAGLSASLGWSRGFARHDWAVGPEVGYNFAHNLRLGVGYNLVGFVDKDLAGDVPTQHGVFLNLRFKFDEGFFALRALADRNDPVNLEAR